MALMHLQSDTHGEIRVSGKKKLTRPVAWFTEPPHPDPVSEIIQVEIIQLGKAHNSKTDYFEWSG